MKLTARLALMMVLLSAYSYSSAQFKTGDRMVGATIGSVFFNSATSKTTVNSIGGTEATITGYGATITPAYGWFISENTAVGVSLNVDPTGQTTRYEENGNTFQKDKTNNLNLGAGGFIRNYFNGSGSFLPFVQASINAGITTAKTSGFYYGINYKQTYTGKSTGGFFTNASALMGLTKKLSEDVGLDLFVGYNFSYNKNNFDRTTLADFMNDGTIDERLENETTTKYTSHGVVLGAGIQVFLRKRNN